MLVWFVNELLLQFPFIAIVFVFSCMSSFLKAFLRNCAFFVCILHVWRNKRIIIIIPLFLSMRLRDCDTLQNAIRPKLKLN